MFQNFKFIPFEKIFSTPLRNGLTRPKSVRGAGVKMINMGELFAHSRIKNIIMDRVPLSEKEFSNYLLKKGDLLFARQSLVLSGAGKCSIFFGDSEPVTYEGHIIRARLNLNNVDPLFYYYYFNSQTGRKSIEGIVEQVAAAGIRGSDLAKLDVPYPPLPTQHAIARILGLLDDKIELNHQMNETLEAMARAIFQSWFLDFDPVRAKAEGRDTGLPPEVAALFPDGFEVVDGREVPRGWGVATLGDYIEPVKGLSYKGEGLCNDGIPLHNLNSVLEGGGYKYPGIKFYNGEYQERHIILPGDVIVTNTEQGFDFLLIGYPAIVPKYFGEMGLFTHHLFKVRPKKQSPLTNHFIYHLLMAPLIREQVIGCTNGTTVNMMYVDGLITPQFILPSDELIQQFEKIVSPMFEMMENNEQQSLTLAQIRDALLPKLMSGEIEVAKEES